MKRQKYFVILCVTISFFGAIAVISGYLFGANSTSKIGQLAVSFVAYSNSLALGNVAIVSVTNRGLDAAWLDGNVEIQYTNTNFDHDYTFAVHGVDIIGRGKLSLEVPLMRKGLRWRAKLAFIPNGQIRKKTLVRKVLPDWPIIRKPTAEYFVLRPYYAYTDWVQD